MSQHLEEIKTAVVNGKHMEIEHLVRKAFADNMDLNSLINDSLIAAMDIVGEKFSAGIRVYALLQLDPAATSRMAAFT